MHEPKEIVIVLWQQRDQEWTFFKRGSIKLNCVTHSFTCAIRATVRWFLFHSSLKFLVIDV